MTGYKYSSILSIPCYSYLLLGLSLQPPDDFTQKHFPNEGTLLKSEYLSQTFVFLDNFMYMYVQ